MAWIARRLCRRWLRRFGAAGGAAQLGARAAVPAEGKQEEQEVAVEGIDDDIPGWMGVAWLIEMRHRAHRDLAVPTMGSGLMSEVWIARYGRMSSTTAQVTRKRCCASCCWRTGPCSATRCSADAWARLLASGDVFGKCAPQCVQHTLQ